MYLYKYLLYLVTIDTPISVVIEMIMANVRIGKSCPEISSYRGYLIKAGRWINGSPPPSRKNIPRKYAVKEPYVFTQSLKCTTISN